jgi:CCR4-NOT transcription complex subunit 6
MRLHIISWNLLADCYIRGISKLFPGDPPSYLLWEERFERIKEQIQNTQADIFCLQEVDHYQDGIEPFLESIGYDSIYLQRPRKPDGCLIAFDASKFSVDGRCEIQLDDLADSQYICDQLYMKQNVCLLLHFRFISTNLKFIVACCHIHWNPNLEDLKNNQVRYILSKIHSAVSSSTSDDSTIPVIFCGDFNSFPSTHMYELITQPFDNSIEKPLRNTDNYSAKEVKFLCEPSLSRLCRWMRVLGLDVAMDSWDGDTATKEGLKSPIHMMMH